MKKHDWIGLGVIIIVYLFSLFFFHKNVFFFKFDKSLLSRYFLSQDIPHEVNGKRLFLSDGDIYLATGYLYATGSNPAEFNFEHPPLIKYLFGFSALLFSNPYIIQILFGIFVLFLTYLLGLKLYNSCLVSIATCFLLLADPLFIDISSQPLLDMGQTAFMLLYTLSILYYPSHFIFQGIALALFAGTKFWVTPLFFITLYVLYNYSKKKREWKIFFLHLLVAFITYSFLYIKTFIDRGGNFNIIFFMLKVLKYRLVHNTSSFFGSSILLFMTGFFKSWWGNKEFMIGNIWSFLWPVSLIVGIVKTSTHLLKKKIDIQTLIAFTPFLYLIFLGVQAPFPRYFLIILPFSYMTFVSWCLRFLLQ